MITEDKKNLMRKVINCFEMGRTVAKNDVIYIYRDGPNSVRQITLSWGITEYGNLRKLIQNYIAVGGEYKDYFKDYVSKIGRQALVNDANFKKLLLKAAKDDAVFQKEMDNMYYEAYFNPAEKFFNQNGFTKSLSMLVILDSCIHSGSVPLFLRNKFSEKVPANGGDEKAWISAYIKARKNWLANHSRTILHGTVYRMNCFLEQIKNDNWDLDKLPIIANGVKITE